MRMEDRLESIKSNLEYAAYNLCEDPHRDVSHVVDSTCAETSLLVAIRDIQNIIAELEES